MAVEVAQDFGSGGSPSSYAPGTGQTVTLTSLWAAFAVTFAVPSISGKTLGTDNNSNTALLFYTSAGSDFNARANSLGLQTIGVDLWGVHIKVGTHTTAATDLYKQPELGPELARCQRYYQTGSIRMSGPSTTGVGLAQTAAFRVSLRANPAITYTNKAAAGNVNTANYTAVSIAPTQFSFDAGAGTNNGGYIASTDWAADAEL
jgi:hypothetical protein